MLQNFATLEHHIYNIHEDNLQILTAFLKNFSTNFTSSVNSNS